MLGWPAIIAAPKNTTDEEISLHKQERNLRGIDMCITRLTAISEKIGCGMLQAIGLQADISGACPGSRTSGRKTACRHGHP